MDLHAFDSDYVERLTRGDAATEEHFTAYFGDLLRLKLRARLRNAQFVEDAMQETFLRVLTTLRRKGGVEHPERLGAFVNSVCNNVLLEFFRGSGRSAQFAEGYDPADAGADVESKLVNEERCEIVRQVMEDLPARDKAILREIFLEERDKDELCVEYGVDREYLRVLLHRAVERARKLMRSRKFSLRA